jgi:antirestriction protein ArdC
MRKSNSSNGKKTDLYEVVTNRIINLLENHKFSWDKPWVTLSEDGKQAHNAVSGRIYSGLNQILLSIIQAKHSYPYGGWLTFRQISREGGRVQFGEKSSEIFFHQLVYYDKEGKRHEPDEVRTMSDTQQEELALKKCLIFRYYNVFNVAQTNGLPVSYYELGEVDELTEIEKDDRAEELINNTGARIIHKLSNEAFYDHINDVICLPDRRQFKDTEPYYETSLHELGHWTGHPARLDRDLYNAFGTEEYAKEELVAELCASFLCSELGFSRCITNNVAYIQNWISVLKDDNRCFITATRDAQKAAEFIKSFQPTTEG